MLFQLVGRVKTTGFSHHTFHCIKSNKAFEIFSKADVTQVVPFWPSAPWWPCLTYDGFSFGPEVIFLIVIDPQSNRFIPAVPESQVFNYGLALSLTSLLHYKDNELLYLANRLPSILLLNKAPNTVKKYLSAFR